MPAIGRMRRRYAKQMMGRLKEGGSFVSDAERQQMEQGLHGAAQAALGAQQMQLGQAARAQTGGSPFQERQFQEGQKAVAKTSADAAVKASGQQRLMEAQLADQRKGRVLAEAKQLHDVNRANAAAAMETAKWFAELPSEQFGTMFEAALNYPGPGAG